MNKYFVPHHWLTVYLILKEGLKMTNEQFTKAQELKERIENLYKESGYFYSALPTHDCQYDKFVVSGLCSDGVADWLFDISDELLEVIKNWYSDKILKLEAEFKNL